MSSYRSSTLPRGESSVATSAAIGKIIARDQPTLRPNSGRYSIGAVAEIFLRSFDRLPDALPWEKSGFEASADEDIAQAE